MLLKKQHLSYFARLTLLLDFLRDWLLVTRQCWIFTNRGKGYHIKHSGKSRGLTALLRERLSNYLTRRDPYVVEKATSELFCCSYLGRSLAVPLMVSQ